MFFCLSDISTDFGFTVALKRDRFFKENMSYSMNCYRQRNRNKLTKLIVNIL